MMKIKAHQQFWNSWAHDYQKFAEQIEPYRDAQIDFAESAIDALGNVAFRDTVRILDIDGGAGNMVAPLLETLAAKRGNLRGVSYTLTDSVETMLKIAQERLDGFRKAYPDVAFKVLFGNTLEPGFIAMTGLNKGDLVMSNWNIEYDPHEIREEIVKLLVDLADQQGIIAVSSTLRLPPGMTLREILLPLGRAQVIHALLTGGPAKMGKVIESLKKITMFGTAISSQHFPEKPTLAELNQLLRSAGIYSAQTGYHLYGASAIVLFREDGGKLSSLPERPIAQALFGKEGYENCPEALTFWGYFKALMRRPKKKHH